MIRVKNDLEIKIQMSPIPPPSGFDYPRVSLLRISTKNFNQGLGNNLGSNLRRSLGVSKNLVLDLTREFIIKPNLVFLGGTLGVN